MTADPDIAVVRDALHYVASSEAYRLARAALDRLEARLHALVAERDRLVAERQRLTDENDKGVRALWDEKNKFMEALEVEMAEKKALIAERERLRDEIDADCIRIVAAEAERDRLREALERCADPAEQEPKTRIARAALEGGLR